MAYGKHYISRFKNRIQKDTYRIEIWEKDFADDDTELKSGESTFSTNWPNGDTDILTPVKSSEGTFTIRTDGSLSIEDFYSDDDERFRVDLYFESDSAGGGTEKLLYSSYLIQEGANEPLTDIKHYLTFKTTDNLGLLKDKIWSDTSGSPETIIALGGYIREALQETGLYSHDTTIDLSLPLRLYNNLYDNTASDRGDASTNDPFAQTILDPAMFLSSDGKWADLYAILEKILGALNADVIQANGYWNVRRIPEYRLFTDGQIPGTEYIYNGMGTDVNAVSLDPIVTIARTGGDVKPILEDQEKSLQRSVRYVKNTFNYEQPAYIIQSDLKIADDAVPYDTNTVGDLRYDDYDLATYFPHWVQRDGDTSYLEIVTDTSTDEETEVERYIVTPSPNDNARGVQFNPIPVSKGDEVDFALQYKTITDTNDELRFTVRYILIDADGNAYTVVDDPPTGSPDYELIWFLIPADEWDQQDGLSPFISSSMAGNIDTTQYQSYAFSSLLAPEHNLPLIPVDSILLIQVCGTNTYAGTHNQTTAWKDIKVTVRNFINESKQIIGQTHTDTGTSTNKATQENDIYIDDSPRNTIAGTLFTDDVTGFSHTDSVTGEDTDIGNVFFTKTKSWHRGTVGGEALRLGNITTQERLELQYKTRLVIEGTFRNLRYDTDKFISPLTLFKFDFIPGKYFIPASMNIDYMQCSFKTRLVEIFSDDTTDAVVFMTGAKELEEGIVSGAIEYDVITYYGGADSFITPSISNSRFTYAGPDTTLDLSVILFVPISGSGTATFTLEKNGVAIATQTLNAIAVFGHISFLETGVSVTGTDYFEVRVDTGGADVDIQSGSINITVNGVIAPYPYSFNYIYDTNR